MRKGLLVVAVMVLAVVASISLALPPGSSYAAVDSAWHGEYFQNPDLQGAPSLVHDDIVIAFDWSIEPPVTAGNVSGWSGDHFSVRWTKRDSFLKDRYVFAARSDDGIRMYVDGKLIIDEWFHRQFTWTATEVDMTAGEHTIVVEYYEDEGRAAIEAGYYPKHPPTATPKAKTPTKTPAKTPTKTPTGGGSGGGGSGSSPKATSTPRPTRTPSLSGTTGAVVTATASSIGAQEIIIEELDGKLFTSLGFPGLVRRSGGSDGWHAYVKNSATKVTFIGRWQFRPQQSGFYEVLAHIPATNNRATRSAVYEVQFNQQSSGQIVVDQTTFSDQWVLLGRFFFVAGPSQQYVQITNATGEPDATREVLIDAMMFTLDN